MKEKKVKCAVCGAKNMRRSKNNNIDMKLKEHLELYPQYCPAINRGEDVYLDSYEFCNDCGYIAVAIDDDLGMTKSIMKSDEYIEPFTPEETCSSHMAYVAALAYHNGGCMKLAAKHYMLAAVAAKQIKSKQKCYKKAWLCLNRIRNQSFEEYLAYLNLMRLMKMFEALESEIKDSIYKHQGIERTLLSRMLRLAEEKNDEYMTYFEMIEG